jgi:hypothetical protein
VSEAVSAAISSDAPHVFWIFQVPVTSPPHPEYVVGHVAGILLLLLEELLPQPMMTRQSEAKKRCFMVKVL